MKVLGFILLFVLALAAALVLAGQVGLLAGQAPADLGLHDGRLKPPSATPNSVSSQADLYPDHPQHAYARIAPLPFDGDGEAAMQRLAGLVKATERCAIVTQQRDYLYAQCRTALLRFTDDVEFWWDRKAGVIQVRSASRLGQGDLGVNRARMEKIRAQFTKN
ncbi:MAG: DUF1499 domain-containing protein [Rhodoferax sp.]|nr:DUF1499 domain-containing protein [Rhodoferax sp.]